jgi:crotonobetainyl-CoA:carnitine CoA-transferase CaiB-like acyl-CoA transferase
MNEKNSHLPLSGVRALELSHAILGPSCGQILADMGAEVIRIERAPEGDYTRELKGFGIGFHTYFNRNKKSIVLDLKSEKGKEVLKKLIASADVMYDNFGPGAMDRLGFGYEACDAINPGIVYCSLKGFMPGPYEHRPSLDNLVQMMGGLAYMTGPAGRPLRAGTSVIDIMGGTFGALGIITALYERKTTGKGQLVRAALFEATAYLVGQHMAMAAFTGEPPPPMPEGEMPWGVYDLFTTADGEMIFIGMTSDFHWKRFCEVFGQEELFADERLKTNNSRCVERKWLIPRLSEMFKRMSSEEVVAGCEKSVIPFAPIRRPDELIEDPHLNRSGGLVETVLPSGKKAKLPKIPLRLGEYDFGLRNEPPEPGEGTHEILKSIGLDKKEIDDLIGQGIVCFKTCK